MSHIILDSHGLNSVAHLKHVENDKGGYHIAIFPKTKWLLFENHTYYGDVESTEDGENEYYKSIHMIPKYHVMKNRVKISMALPRLDINNEPYLFIPKTNKYSQRKIIGTKRDKIKYSITKNYYIFDVDDEYVIHDNAKLFF